MSQDENVIVIADEINLSDLWASLKAAKLELFSIVMTFFVLALFFSLMQEDMYQTETLLVPAESGQAVNPMLAQLGAAAGLVGIEVGGEQESQITTAIATMLSRDFTRAFIDEHELLVPLFAGRWNKAENLSEIRRDVYDEDTESWLIDPPSPEEIFKKFSEILTISQNQNTGLVTVSLEWSDPQLIKDWANWLVEDINLLIKEQDLEEATSSIEYLQNQLQATQLVEMQRAFYQLIESQTRIVMLADVREDYVFRVVDHAFVPEEKTSPRVVLILLISLVVGLFSAISIVLLRDSIRKSS